MPEHDKVSCKTFTMVLNIEGRIFHTTERTAKAIPGSLLSSLGVAPNIMMSIQMPIVSIETLPCFHTSLQLIVIPRYM